MFIKSINIYIIFICEKYRIKALSREKINFIYKIIY